MAQPPSGFYGLSAGGVKSGELRAKLNIGTRKTEAKNLKPDATSEATPQISRQRPASNDILDTATLDLLATWRLQDITENPADLQAAEQELAEFKKAVNEGRSAAGETPLYL